MILRHGVTASYIILEGYERHKERTAIRDWCLDNGQVIDAHDASSTGKADMVDQTIVRFPNRDDALLCYLTIKG